MAFFASLVVTALVVACGDPTAPTSPVSPYTLTSVGAKPLPVMMYQEPGYTLQVISGTAAFTADGKYTLSLTTTETVDGKASNYVDHESGAWTVDAGGHVTMTPMDGDPHDATWSGTTLTMTLLDVNFLFTMTR